MNRRALLLGGLAVLAAPAILRATAPTLRVGAILPLAGRGLPEAGINLSIPAESARLGLVLAADDLLRENEGAAPALRLANAPEAGAARRAAERLIEHDRATVLIGGFSSGDARAIAEVATGAGALFLNIAAPADSLRGDCAALHVEAAAADYCAALAATHLARGRSRWHLIVQDGGDRAAQAAQLRAELAARGAAVASESAVTADASSLQPALDAVAGSGADLAVLLTDWLVQLAGLAKAEARAPGVPITGFPWPATQTADFANRARQYAPTAGTAERVSLWSPAARTPGSAALNADFVARWRVPMDASAWAAHTALRLVAQAAAATGSTRGEDLGLWLRGQPLAAGKDAALGFDARGQLRQPLYAVRVNPAATSSTLPEAMVQRTELLARIDDPAPAAARPAPACPDPRRTP